MVQPLAGSVFLKNAQKNTTSNAVSLTAFFRPTSDAYKSSRLRFIIGKCRCSTDKSNFCMWSYGIQKADKAILYLLCAKKNKIQ